MADQLAANYDPNADVLYLAVGAPVPADTDEDDNGLLVRTAYDGRTCGVTILAFDKHWGRSRELLASLVSSHLHVPTNLVFSVLASVQR